MAASSQAISAFHVIQDAVHLLKEEFHPLKIILFGSYARDDATADSDLDFLVVMPNGTDRRGSAIEMHRHLRELSLPKDVLVTTPKEIAMRGDLLGTALRSALREGKILYERQ